MIRKNVNLSGVKAAVSRLYDQKVRVRVNLGRNRVVEYVGRLSAVYPALFTVLPEDAFRGKTTYAYAEVLCGTVALFPFEKER